MPTMDLQTPLSRREQIETLDTHKCRASQDLLPAERTSPLTELEQRKREDTGKKHVSQTILSPQKAEEPYQVNLDEIPLTDVLEYIKRVSSIQTLYSIQRCIEKIRVSHELKKYKGGRVIAVHENSGKPSELGITNKLLETAGSNNEEIHPENILNKSEMLEAVIQKSKKPVERQLDIRKLRMAQKILPFTQVPVVKMSTEIPSPEIVIEIELGSGSLNKFLTEAKRQELKKVVSAIRAKIMGGRGNGAQTVLTNNITQA